ncbi:MAG: hypothetical protein HC906_11080 [Bacteroidales bacterium]|nr:hypothetical protein [Bacteroidales bacterium]
MTLNSIVKLEKTGKTSVFETNGFVFSIHEDRNNDIWYGTWSNGFGKIDADRNSQLRFSSSGKSKSLSSDIVLAINDDFDNNLWIGTKGGGLNISPIRILNQGESTFAVYQQIENDTSSLSNNNITCIFIAKDSSIWVGTEIGLNKVLFPKNTSRLEAIMQGKLLFKPYFVSDGLPNNTVCGILQDASGLLWIGTRDGLSCMNPESNTFINYSEKDGLPAGEFHTNAFYKADDKELYYGGINGITILILQILNKTLTRLKLYSLHSKYLIKR